MSCPRCSIRTLASSTVQHRSSMHVQARIYAMGSRRHPQRQLSGSARSVFLYDGKRAEPTRLSNVFIPTIKKAQQAAANDELPLQSLNLLLRGGYIRQSSSGLFTLLPIGYRMLRKIERIIDEEFKRVGAARLEMPGLLSSALWRRSGRYEAMGSELYKLRDRKEQEFVLGPTHEEEVTKLVGEEIQSAKQLPVRVYQITRKNRDEPRPKSGLLRTREFTMADMYTFDATLPAAEETYETIRSAYSRIMTRMLELPEGRGTWRMAEADMGAIGGKRSHEYHFEDPIGEDVLLSCTTCSYSSNSELAISAPCDDSDQLPMVSEDVTVRLYGPSQPESAAMIPSTLKRSAVTAVVVPSSRKVNEIKVVKTMAEGCVELKSSSAPDGAASWDWTERPEGPLASFERLEVLADHECGSMEPEELLDAVRARLVLYSTPPAHGPSDASAWPTLADFFPSQFLDPSPLLSTTSHNTEEAALTLRLADIREAAEGDNCSQCGRASLTATRAIEVGHTFLLGTRYAEALGVGYTGGQPDPNVRQPFQMGCYGIGVSRLIGAIAQRAAQLFAAAIEENATPSSQARERERCGFLWPPAVAPFSALVLPSSPYTAEKQSAAERLCAALERSGIEDSDVALDDRTALSLGVRLNDADLVGYPRVLILGRHWERTGEVEERIWRNGTLQTEYIALDSLLSAA